MAMPDDANPAGAQPRPPASDRGETRAPSAAAFELLLEDLVAAGLHQRTLPQFRKARLRFRLLVTLGLACFVGMGVYQYSRDGAAIDLFAPLAAAALLLSLFTPRAARRQVERSCAKMARGMLPLAQTLILNPDGVVSKTGRLDRHWEWTAIQRIDELPEHLLIYASAREVLIAPARAFASMEQFRAFAELARQYRRQASAPGDDAP